MKHAKRVHQKIQSGEESGVQGLLEQWLRDGKLTEMEALLSATDMFTAGVDSVRNYSVTVVYGLVFQHATLKSWAQNGPACLAWE